MAKQMQSLKDLLPGVLAQFSGDSEVSLIFLIELWPRLVGAHLARHCQPAALSGRILTIRAAVGWRPALLQLRSELLKSVNELWGTRLVERILVVEHLEEKK